MGHISFRSVLTVLIYWVRTNLITKNTEVLLHGNKETGLEVNAEKTALAHMVVSHVSCCRTNSLYRPKVS